MRNIFVNKLIERARIDKDIFLLTGDLGYRVLEPFRDEFSDRFINVGIAENNMVGIGTGLALAKKKIFLYSILPFLIYKNLEQIRNNICLHDLNIKLIGNGGGFHYGVHGISHNTSEDLSIMRSLPNMTVFSPGSKIEAEMIINLMFDHIGPSFIRLGRVPDREYLQETPKKYQLGDILELKKGNDLSLFCAGNIIDEVYETAINLESKGIKAQVVSFPTIKPINNDHVISFAKNTSKIFTIEEHSIIGGLGGAISEILMESNLSNIFFKRIALSDRCHNKSGSQQFLRKINGLTSELLTKQILSYVK